MAGVARLAALLLLQLAQRPTANGACVVKKRMVLASLKHDDDNDHAKRRRLQGAVCSSDSPCPVGQYCSSARGSSGTCMVCLPGQCGCKDKLADNFDPTAEHADPSCFYSEVCGGTVGIAVLATESQACSRNLHGDGWDDQAQCMAIGCCAWVEQKCVGSSADPYRKVCLHAGLDASSVATTTIAAQIIIPADATALLANPAAAEAYKIGFQQDMAAEFGIAASRITNVELVAGSLIVRFDVVSDPMVHAIVVDLSTFETKINDGVSLANAAAQASARDSTLTFPAAMTAATAAEAVALRPPELEPEPGVESSAGDGGGNDEQTGVQACEGHNFDEAQCTQPGPGCCTYSAGQCETAVGDDMCSSAGGGSSPCQSEAAACQSDTSCDNLWNQDPRDDTACSANALCAALVGCETGGGGGGGGRRRTQDVTVQNIPYAKADYTQVHENSGWRSDVHAWQPASEWTCTDVSPACADRCDTADYTTRARLDSTTTSAGQGLRYIERYAAYHDLSGDYGGAMQIESQAIWGDAKLSVSFATFTRNTASYQGGAIHMLGCDATISYSSFTNNSAPLQGGAIFASAHSVLNLSFVTFTGNVVGESHAINYAKCTDGSINPRAQTPCSSHTYVQDQHDESTCRTLSVPERQEPCCTWTPTGQEICEGTTIYYSRPSDESTCGEVGSTADQTPCCVWSGSECLSNIGQEPCGLSAPFRCLSAIGQNQCGDEDAETGDQACDAFTCTIGSCRHSWLDRDNVVPKGGAIYVDAGHVNTHFTMFIDNAALDWTPILRTECIASNECHNIASYGGAVYHYGRMGGLGERAFTQSLTFSRTSFFGNTAHFGGAVAGFPVTFTAERSIFGSVDAPNFSCESTPDDKTVSTSGWTRENGWDASSGCRRNDNLTAANGQFGNAILFEPADFEFKSIRITETEILRNYLLVYDDSSSRMAGDVNGEYSVKGMSTLAGCDQWPCAAGESCEYRDYSTFCTPCTGSNVGVRRPDGGSVACRACKSGKQPSADRSECLDCELGKFSANGDSCQSCPSGKVPLEGRAGCEACPPGQTSLNGTCVCADKTYNSSFGFIFCFDQNFHSDRLQADDYTAMRVQFDRGQQCLECPSCVSCDVHSAPMLLPGWSLSPKALEIWGGGLNKRSTGPDGRERPRSVFSCGVGGEVCDANGTTSTAPPQINSQCTDGHTGTLCGVCMDGWQGSFGELCAACEASDWTVPAIALLSILVVIIFFYERLKTKTAEMQGRLDGVRAKYKLARKAVQQARKVQSQAAEELDNIDEEGAFQATLDTVKIVVGNLQIIAQLPVALKFSCPACANLKKMMIVLPAVNLDLLQSFSVDCLVTVNLYHRFAFFLLVPVATVAVVLAWGRMSTAVQVREVTAEGTAAAADAHARSAKANQIAMLVVFLAYPSVSTTIFSVFMCRDLDFNQSVHVYDATVDCNSAEYAVLWLAALVALIFVPIGVPAFFGCLLYKNRERLNSKQPDTICFEVFATTARSILHPKELTDDELRSMYSVIDEDDSGEVSTEELWHSALESVRVVSTARDDQVIHKSHVKQRLRAVTVWKLQTDESEEVRASEAASSHTRRTWWYGGPDEFRFLVRAYEPSFYWFELVNYAKKFALSGVLVFAGPGSTAQLYVGLIASFYFFALLTRTMPYKNAKTDRSAVIVEANLFFTILCLLMLKINLTGEWLTRGFYDSALASSNIVVALVPTGIAVVVGLHRLASEWQDSTHNGLSKGDRVRVLDCPTDLDSCGHIATVLGTNDGVITARVQIGKKSKKTIGLRKMCCGVKAAVHDREFTRAQLQLVLDRRQFLRMCAGVCKLVLMCWRARDTVDEEVEEVQDKSPKGIADEAVSKVHEVEGIEDDDDGTEYSLKDAALDALQPRIEPHLEDKYNIKWQHAKEVIHKLSSLAELHAALDDHETFIGGIAELVAPAVREALLNKLRPQLEPVLLQHSLTWELSKPLLKQLTSIDRLHAAVDDPDTFIKELVASSGPAAKALTIAKLRPVIEPTMVKRGILAEVTDAAGEKGEKGGAGAGVAAEKVSAAVGELQLPTWESFVPAFSLIESVEELQAALTDPEALLDSLLSTAADTATAAGKAFAIARLRPLLEKAVLDAADLSWEGIVPILDQIDSIEELQAALDGPDAFLRTLLSAASPYAAQLALARLELLLRPIAEAQGLAWDNAMTVLTVMSVEELHAGLAEPQALMERVMELVPPGP